MFFKKEQVEQAKRMKIKLRTESSFERPETNAATSDRTKSVKRPPVITFERPKLIYSLLAPPVLSSERPNLEVRDVPIRPEKRISDPFAFYLKINKLKFEVKNFEDLKCSGGISISCSYSMSHRPC